MANSILSWMLWVKVQVALVLNTLDLIYQIIPSSYSFTKWLPHQPEGGSQLHLMSPHMSFKLQIPLFGDGNRRMRTDSLNRCHGNVIVSAAITALCLTNSHKSASLYKEDVVALHSHSIIRYCCTHGVTCGRWNSPFFCLEADISLCMVTLEGSFSGLDIVPARHLLALAKGFIR